MRRCRAATGTDAPRAPSKRRKRWEDYTAGQRRALGLLAAVEIGLAAAAWRDLAYRDSSEVRGSKRVWAVVIAVNFVGPLSYYRWGRRPAVPAPPEERGAERHAAVTAAG